MLVTHSHNVLALFTALAGLAAFASIAPAAAPGVKAVHKHCEGNPECLVSCHDADPRTGFCWTYGNYFGEELANVCWGGKTTPGCKGQPNGATPTDGFGYQCQQGRAQYPCDISKDKQKGNERAKKSFSNATAQCDMAVFLPEDKEMQSQKFFKSQMMGLPDECKAWIDDLMGDNPFVTVGDEYKHYKNAPGSFFPSASGGNAPGTPKCSEVETVLEHSGVTGLLAVANLPNWHVCAQVSTRKAMLAGKWEKYFEMIGEVVRCSDRTIFDGGSHGAIHGSVWFRIAHTPGEVEWDVWERYHQMHYGDVAHGVGHGVFYKYNAATEGIPLCPCCLPAQMSSDVALKLALKECYEHGGRESVPLSLSVGCGYGVFHGNSQYSQVLFGTPNNRPKNPVWYCDNHYAGWCFNMYFDHGHMINTSYTKALAAETFGYLMDAPRYVTGFCMPEHPFMHVAGRTPYQMSQACIWGMSAVLFPVFYHILTIGMVEGTSDRCSVCDTIRHAPGLTANFAGFLCPILVQRMSNEIMNAPHSILYTWCDLFAASAPSLEVKEKRWLSCLHAIYYYAPPEILADNPCDDDIKAVSPAVAKNCLMLITNPWDEPGFALLDTLDAM